MPQRIDQGLQLRAALPHPLRQRGAGQREAGVSEDVFLAIQQQMIGVLGHQHMGQEARSRNAFVDDVCRHARLNQRLALCAGPFAANVALNGEHARLVVELFGDVLADALQLTATAAGSGFGLVADLAARKVCGQRLAPGLLLLTRSGFRRVCRTQLHDLLADRLQVRIQCFVQQVFLLGAVALGLGSKH